MLRVAIFVLSVVALVGCGSSMLPFGEDVRKSGTEIGEEEMATIEDRMSLELPDGTIGIECLYLGDALDPSLYTKLHIDRDRLDEARRIVRRLANESPSFPAHDEMMSWFVTRPEDAILNRDGEWSEFNYGHAAITLEDDEYYLYLVWWTM